MIFLLVVGLAVALGRALGGRLHELGQLTLNGAWLFFGAIVIQVVAFPASFLPWSTGAEPGRWLWLASYVCLLCGAVVNLHLRGVLLAAGGMVANVAAIVANGGQMPALPEAAAAAGLDPEQHNSITTSEPRLEWLVDRWAAPDAVPFANVYSVGDVLLAAGAFVIVLSAMRVPLLARLPRPRLALR